MDRLYQSKAMLRIQIYWKYSHNRPIFSKFVLSVARVRVSSNWSHILSVTLAVVEHRGQSPQKTEKGNF